ncbi:hypothetical protein D3C87_1574460 [compost metagenome]
MLEAAGRAVVVLPEHPAVSARLAASRESRSHDEPWRAVCPVIAVPLYQEACSRSCLFRLGLFQDILHLRLDLPHSIELCGFGITAIRLGLFIN